MSSKLIDLDGKKQEFVMAFVQELNLPSWNTIMDEFWLTMVSNIIYDYYSANKHRIIDEKSNLILRKEYALALTIDEFKKSFLTGEADKFKGYVLKLMNQVRQFEPNSRVYICFYSGSSDHFLSAMIDERYIMLGMHMGDMII